MSPAAAQTPHTTLFPKLHAGQSLTYLIQYRTEKNVKTESRVVTPAGPDDAQTDARWLLHIEIVDVRPQGERAAIHARSQFQKLDSGVPWSNAAEAQPQPNPHESIPESKPVEFTILPDGHVEPVNGLADLFPEQRQAWQEWMRQFAIAGTFPPGGVKRGQSWKSIEEEQSPSPITRLQWDKQGTYVRDEPCAATQFPSGTGAAQKNSPPETCAVVLTHAVLKQKSSPKDTTPGDFSSQGLRTMGTASGTNETISYISLRTGLVVRVTEEAHQFMDVIVAKPDASNQVHYNVSAKSHSEVLLVDTLAR